MPTTKPATKTQSLKSASKPLPTSKSSAVSKGKTLKPSKPPAKNENKSIKKSLDVKKDLVVNYEVKDDNKPTTDLEDPYEDEKFEEYSAYDDDFEEDETTVETLLNNKPIALQENNLPPMLTEEEKRYPNNKLKEIQEPKDLEKALEDQPSHKVDMRETTNDLDSLEYDYNDDFEDEEEESSDESEILEPKKPEESFFQPKTSSNYMVEKPTPKTEIKKTSLEAQLYNTRYDNIKKFVEFTLTNSMTFELSPQTQYELYMRNFASSSSFQNMATQAPSENEICERECQSDLITTTAVSSGDENFNLKFNRKKVIRPDTTNLRGFLDKWTFIMSDILDERAKSLENNTGKKGTEVSKVDYKQEIFRNRTITQILMSQNLMFIVWSKNNETINDSIGGKSFVSIFNSPDSSNPSKILVSESEISFCSNFSSYNKLCFGGTVDGSLLIWNTDDISNFDGIYPLHRHVFVENSYSRLKIITPIFSSICDLSRDLKDKHLHHQGKIIKISPYCMSRNNAETNFFLQILSLDEYGKCILWTLLDVDKEYSAELSVTVGGSLKLKPLMFSFFSGPLSR
jgi:hypothetical protein